MIHGSYSIKYFLHFMEPKCSLLEPFCMLCSVPADYISSLIYILCC
jgi:hypothetical protein